MSVDTNNAACQDALNLIQYTRQSVFLTGKAGTGKSTFLRYVCEQMCIRDRLEVILPMPVASSPSTKNPIIQPLHGEVK